MYSKNRIFLRLLGSFYEQTANTPFSERLDYIYTSMLFNRYVDILQKAIYSIDSSSPAVSHFGYVSSSEIDIQNSTINIKGIDKKYIGTKGLISFGYLDVDKFYKIDENGVVEQEVISKLSEYDIENIPILYITDQPPFEYGNIVFDFSEFADNSDILYLSSVTTKMVSEQIMYFPHSKSNIERLANIVMGAVYVIDAEEEVLYVSDDRIITSKNTYSLYDYNKGKQCVSVGDTVRNGQLLTKLATLIQDPTYIPDASKLNALLSIGGLSESSENFLSTLSTAIVKRSMPIFVDIEALSILPKEILSIVSATFKYISTANTSVVSSKKEEETISVVSDGGYLIVSSSDVEMNTVWKWVLNTDGFSSEFIADIESTILQAVSQDADSTDDSVVYSENFEMSDEIYVDQPMEQLILDDSNVDISEEDEMSGLLSEHDIYDIDAIHTAIESRVDEMSFEDNDVFDNIVAKFETIATSVEDSKNTISTSRAATIILNEIGKSLIVETIETDVIDGIPFVGEIKSSSIGTYDISDAILQTDAFPVDISESEVSTANLYEISVLPSDSIMKSTILKDVEDINIDDSNSTMFMLVTGEDIDGTDTLDVESDNQVDDA